MGLSQLLLVAVTGVVAAAVVGSSILPSVTFETAGLILLWFVLGYAFYSCAFAAAGSSISRMEEAQGVAMPVTVVIVISYLTAVNTAQDPESSAARLFSLLPPTAPMNATARIALGNAAWWELPVSAGLMLIATFLLIRLAARVYTGAILQFGPRVRMTEAWRSAGTTPTR
jgi:ABC-2 type transport system permease protein